MPVSFAGKPCLDPRALYVSCRDQNLSTDWASRPNAFDCPLGCRPGTGWLLLSRSVLDAISPDGTFAGTYDLVFGGDSGSVVLKGLYVVSSACVSPGGRGGEAAYLVGVADKRILLARLLVDVAYNSRSASDGTLLTPSLDAGVAWTWATLFADLWGRASVLGTCPGLPFAPDGTPGDLEFYQVPFAEAMDAVLDRLGCALRYDPTAGTFSVVRLGSADGTATATLAQYESAGLRVWDGYNGFGVPAVVPEKVRVLFRKVPHVRDGSSPFYALDVADGTPLTGVTAGTLLPVEDELGATYDDTPALTNSAALATRAAERAADTFRRLKVAAAGLEVTYAGAWADAGILPGSLIDLVRWSELASGITPDAGLITTVRRWVPPTRGDYPSVTTPLAPGAPSTSQAGYCGLAALQKKDCLAVRGTTIVLSYDATSGKWTSTDLYTYPGGSGTFAFWNDAGRPRLTLTVTAGSTTAALDLIFCPATGCFVGGALTGHLAGSAAPCAGATFPVCLSCTTCPGHATACCPDGITLPGTLYATISGGSGSCACANGVYELSYNPALSHWECSTTLCGSVTFMYLFCNGEFFGFNTTCNDGAFDANANCGGEFPILTTVSCSPVMLTGTTYSCCPCGSLLTVTVTE